MFYHRPNKEHSEIFLNFLHTLTSVDSTCNYLSDIVIEVVNGI
jgi:hypothetical protein